MNITLMILLEGLDITRKELKPGVTATYTKRFHQFPISTSTSRTIAQDFATINTSRGVIEAVGLVMQFTLDPEDIVLDTRQYETAHNAQSEIVLRPDKPYKVKLVSVKHYGESREDRPRTLKEKQVEKKELRLEVRDDGIIEDDQSKLMWFSDPKGFRFNWGVAKRIVDDVKAGGYNDWRLPTAKELKSLFTRDKKAFKDVFEEEPYSATWTSNPYHAFNIQDMKEEQPGAAWSFPVLLVRDI